MLTKQILWDLFTRATPVIAVYLWKKYNNKKAQKKLRVSNSQLTAKTTYYPQIMGLKNGVLINGCVNRVFEQTEITRFLILIGINGKEAMQHVSVVLARTKGNPEVDPKVYQDLKTDKDYSRRLKRLEKEGEIVIDVFEMPRGMLKSIYYKEMISHSILKFIARTNIDEGNDAFAFASIATDTENPISEFDKIIINKEFELIKKYLKS
ncbi:hypothetical protein AVT42_gp31 [Polaribacter phage P12002S]|uniref:Uncharacterized protein n=1 Tax=Polaribacter phage P12002S TaxID=1647387 RepID=A0A0F7IJP3_9CAUD|nr:hypothetical protein AVT42_gp31 [Polaribacter phage P12002S]AKG94287.1 hypothetical protein P12002S_0031 [Polaribacter phage P12002S]